MLKKCAIVLALLAIASVSMAQSQAAFEKYWERLCNVTTGADDVRTMAVWPAGNIFVTIDRQTPATGALTVFNLQSGLKNVYPEEIAITGAVDSVPTGLYKLCDGDFTDDGKLVAAQLSYASGQPLNVYIWDSVTTGPRKIYTTAGMAGDWKGYRLGDAVDVYGSTADNSAVVLISGNNAASKPLKLTTADNGRTWTATDLAGACKAQDIQIMGDGTFYALSAGAVLQKYDINTGAAIGTTAPDRIAVGAGLNWGAFAIDTVKGRVFAMGYQTQSKLSVYNLATGALIETFADAIDVGAQTTGTFNGSASCELAVSPGGGRYILALSERNGCARYTYSTQVLVDKVGTAPFTAASLQGAINAYNAGGAFDPDTYTTVTKPLVVKLDKSQEPFEEAINLDDSAAGIGQIKGDLVLKGSSALTKLALKKVSGTLGGNDDGCCVHQNVAGVAFKDLLIYPWKGVVAQEVTDDLIKADENSANSSLNWIEFWNVILTNIKADGSPMVTSKAEALVGPIPAAGSQMLTTGNYSACDTLLKIWNDTGESLSRVMDNLTIYGAPSIGMIPFMNGSADESTYMNNCLLAWNKYAGAAIGFRAGAGKKHLRVSGDDAGKGPLNCTAAIQNEWHGLYFVGSIDGIAKLDNYLCYVDAAGDTAGNDARGISGSSWVDLAMRDSIICATNACVVDGVTNYAQTPALWERCTLHNVLPTGNNTIFSVGSSTPLTLKDCIISGAGTKFSGTLTAGVNLINCDLVQEGPDAITAVADAGVIVTSSGLVMSAPVYMNKTNPNKADLMDVNATALAGKSSTAGFLSGGADPYLGIQVAPASYDFGPVTVGGAPIDKEFVVTNLSAISGNNLLISGTTKVLPGSPDFKVQTAAPASLAPGTTGSLVLRCVPISNGALAATFNVNSNASNAPTLPIVVTATGSGGPTDQTFNIASGGTAYSAAEAALGKSVSAADLLNGKTGTIVAGGFHSATVGGVANLTNGVFDANGLTVIGADVGTGAPSVVLEYSFVADNLLAAITKIDVFSGHDGDGARVFINCKVEVDTGTGYTEVSRLKTGPFGIAKPNASSSAYVEWTGSLTGVQMIKFTFEDVSHNSTGFFQAPDDNTTNPPLNYPNQGTILKEIDVFGTTSIFNGVSDWTMQN